MDKDEAMRLLKGGEEGVKEWDKRRKTGEEIPALESANLCGADLSGATLSGANLSLADLSSANLSLANLRSADLRGADLRGADLSSADLSGATLDEAIVENAISTRCRGRIRGTPATPMKLRVGDDEPPRVLAGSDAIDFLRNLPTSTAHTEEPEEASGTEDPRTSIEIFIDPGSTAHTEEPEEASGTEDPRTSIEIFIDPGDASKETIQAVLERLSDLHRAAGGLGLEFTVDEQDVRVMAGALV